MNIHGGFVCLYSFYPILLLCSIKIAKTQKKNKTKKLQTPKKKKKKFAVEQKLLLTRSWLDLVVRASRFSVMYKRIEERRFAQDLNNLRHRSAIIIQKSYR